MKIVNILAADLKRALLSWRFLLCSCSVSLVMFAAVTGFMKAPLNSVWYLAVLGIGGSGTASMILCTLPVFAFAISFASEWEERAVSFWVVRTGVVRYTLSKLLVSALSGFFTVAVGIIVFMLILRSRYPWINIQVTDCQYETLMMQGSVFSGISLYIIHFALSGALTAMCAMCVSIYLPNRFVAAASPVVLHFTLLRITSLIPIPAYLQPINWVEGIYNASTPAATLMIKLLTVLVLCCFMGAAAMLRIGRRIRDV